MTYMVKNTLFKIQVRLYLTLNKNIPIHTCIPMGSPCLFKPNGQAVAGRPNTLMIAVYEKLNGLHNGS